MEKNIRQVLERPFEQELIRTREGPGGMQLTYVEVQAYIDRLNEAFDGAWSFELISREQVEDQVIVEGVGGHPGPRDSGPAARLESPEAVGLR